MDVKDPQVFEKTESNSDLEHGNSKDAPVPYTGIVDEKEYGHVRRGLKARHVQFIAIGGIIGTGLFVGTGSALVRAGPLSILLAYTIVGTVIYSLMLAIGEVNPSAILQIFVLLTDSLDDDLAPDSGRFDYLCLSVLGLLLGICYGMELHIWCCVNWYDPIFQLDGAC